MKSFWEMVVGCVVILAATAVAETLTIGGVAYYDARWGAVTPATVSIIHVRGIETVPLEKLPEDLQQRFHYDPTRAASYRAQEQAREKMRLARLEATEQEQAQVAERAHQRAEQQRQQRSQWVKQNTVVVDGKRVERSQLTVLTGFLVKTGEAFAEPTPGPSGGGEPNSGAGRSLPSTGVLLELAKPKGKLPDNPLYQLRPGLWESVGEIVFLKRYTTDLEEGMLLRVAGLAAGHVRGLRAFVTADPNWKQASPEGNGGVNATFR